MTVSVWQRGDEAPVEAEVVVVGAGIAGASAAYWLGTLGKRVAVVDRAAAATGASGRNAGFLTLGSVGHFARRVEEAGLAAALLQRRMVRESLSLLRQDLLEDGGCGYAHRGSYSLADTDEEMETLAKAAALLASEGFEVEAAGAGEVERRLGARGFVGGVREGEDAEVDPVCLVRRIVERSGAAFYPDHEVYRIEEREGGVTVHTARRRFVGGAAVLAAGGYLPELDLLPEAPSLSGLVTPARAQILATSPVPRFLAAPCYVRSVLAYLRQLPDGRVIAGGFRHISKDRSAADRIEPEVDRAIETFLRDRFPAAAEASVERRWSGLLGLSVDGLPLVGLAPGRRRLFVAAGFSGHGLGWGFLAGKLLAERLARGEEPPLVSAARFA